MAVFTASAPIDMLAFVNSARLGEFFQYAVPSGTSTRVVFVDSYDGITERLILTGSFAGYVDGLPTTGTITRAQYNISGGESFSFAGIDMSVETFTEFVLNGDSVGLFSTLLAGADTMNGSTGSDVLLGFGGDDTIDGRGGADQMAGMSGNDRYKVNDINDFVIELENDGIDLVTSGVDFTLSENVENLRLSSSAVVGEGNGLDNEIIATDSVNTLRGFGGNDLLAGRGGRDVLDGGDGNDIIDGGLGKDTLTGGTGADAFVFRNGETASGRFSADLITDFSHAEGDQIQLNVIDAKTTVDGNQRFSWLSDGAFTGVAGQLRYYQANGMTYIEGDTDGDSIADVVLALEGTIDLVAADFLF